MFETKIAKECLKMQGVLEPTKLDVARWVDRFHLSQLGTIKKLGLYVSLPALRKFLDIKLDGVLDEKDS